MSQRRPIAPEIASWLDEQPEADRAALLEAWSAAGSAAPVEPSVRERAWKTVSSRMRAVRPALSPVSRPSLVARIIPLFARPVARPFALAASIALFIAVGLSLRPSVSVYVGAPLADGITNVVLEDGSAVALSPGSRLTVGRDFDGSERKVTLTGEGFFDVAHEARPFRVATFNASVEVLGTAFNVRAWPDAMERDTEVYVARGAVRVRAVEMPAMDVTLSPGEQTVVTATPQPPVALETARVLSWMEGGLAFDDAPMGDVLDELARRHAVTVQADASVRAIRVSYWKRTEVGVDEMLADLADTADLRYRRTSRGFELYRP